VETRRSLALRDHDFRYFWAGQTLSVVGTQVTAVALPIVAAVTLGSGAGGVSAVATATFLPNVVLPLFAGAWLESRRKRPAMIGADIVRACALAVIPAAWGLGLLSLPLLVAVGLVVGAASVVFDVGSFAYVPTLVERADLAPANRALQGSATAAQVGGPGLAGLLVQAFGAPIALAVDAVSYLASALGVSAARRPEPPLQPSEETVRVLDGVRWLWSNRVLRALTLHASIYNAGSQIFTVNLVVYALQDRGLSAGEYGAALSASGAGALLGTLVALRLARRLGYGRAFAASLALSTGMPLVVVLLPGSGTAFAFQLGAVLTLSGAGLGSANVLSTTLRQIVTPITSLARTNGGYRLLVFGTIPLGSATGGILGSTLGSRAALALGGCALIASALPMLQRRIRRLQTAEEAATAAAAA
jgi:MFS family permease